MFSQRLSIPNITSRPVVDRPTYTFGYEDGHLENVLIKDFNKKRIVAIGGSGTRCFPLLAHSLDICVYISSTERQIFFWDLVISSFKKFSWKDFIFFWGLPPFDEKKMGKRREKLFFSLKVELKIQEYFFKWFQENSWEPLAFNGRWESAIQMLSNIIRLTLGSKFDDIFKFMSLEDQRKYYKEIFPPTKWALIIGVFSQSNLLNSFIKNKKLSEQKTPRNIYSIYKTSFDQIFHHSLARNNFFLHLCFFGKIYHPDGLPDFSTKVVFEKIRKNLLENTIDVGSHNFKLEECLEKAAPIDLLSICDQDEIINKLPVEEVFKIARKYMSAGGIIVWRSMYRSALPHMTGTRELTNQYKSEIQKDKVQLQRLQIYQCISNH